MLTAVQGEVIRGPAVDPRYGKHLHIDPPIETSRVGKFPTQAVVVTAAARRIIDLSKGGDKVATVLVSGSQDATLHPDFREISENLRELANKWFPRSKLTLICRNPHLDPPDVRQGLVVYDRALVRVEAGTQKTFTALTGDSGTSFKQLVESLANLDLSNITVQACFLRGAIDNSTDNEVRAWARYVGAIKPAKVEICTLAKEDKTRKVKPVTKTRMTEIHDELAEKVSVEIEVIDPE